MGDALAWAQAMCTGHKISDLTYDELEIQLKVVFNRPFEPDATNRLLTIQQGTHSVAQYAMEFWRLALEVGWNELLLMRVFHWGLSRQLQDIVALSRRPREFESLISLATELDTYPVGHYLVPAIPPYPFCHLIPFFPAWLLWVT